LVLVNVERVIGVFGKLNLLAGVTNVREYRVNFEGVFNKRDIECGVLMGVKLTFGGLLMTDKSIATDSIDSCEFKIVVFKLSVIVILVLCSGVS